MKQKMHNLLFEYLLSMLLVMVFADCRGKETILQKMVLNDSDSGYVQQQDTVPLENITDTAAYRIKIKELANGDKTGRWPVNAAFPAKGALLPYNRIVAFYGNFYSKQMGILGEFESTVVLQKLRMQVKEWENADSLTPVVPAIHYIAVTAQASAGDGHYRFRMPDKEIQKAIILADSLKGLVFLDIQVGLSSLAQELPRLEKFLRLPNVHIGIDPEFSMKNGGVPGSSIGSFDATDINYAAGFLASMVQQYQLPPKILVIHRFTSAMVTNYKNIVTRPEVQIVMDMDGFGSPTLKKSSYLWFINRQPVQFTGFKIFYKNDVKTGGRIMRPAELLQLQPKPIYIQYQ